MTAATRPPEPPATCGNPGCLLSPRASAAGALGRWARARAIVWLESPPRSFNPEIRAGEFGLAGSLAVFLMPSLSRSKLLLYLPLVVSLVVCGAGAARAQDELDEGE